MIWRGAFALGAIALACAPAAAALSGPAGGPLHFEIPLVALAPTVTAKEQANNGDVLFEQPLRFAGAVRLKAAFPVLIPETFKGKIDITVPAGTIFVKAVAAGSTYYCATRVGVAYGFWGGLDIGVCLSDANGDGVFDSFLPVSNFTSRLRSPAEMLRAGAAASPVSVAYERIADADAPALMLHVVFYNDGGGLTKFVFHQFASVAMEVCVPLALTIDDADYATGGSGACDALDWPSSLRPRDNYDVIARRYSVAARASESETATWGPISLTLSGLEGNRVSSTSQGGLAPGPVSSSVRDMMFLGTDLRHELTILHIEPASKESL